jgi:hypothetical protein
MFVILAIATVGRFGEPAKGAIPQIIPLFRDPDKDVIPFWILDFGFWIVERLQSASFKNPSVISIIQIGIRGMAASVLSALGDQSQ